MLLELQKSPHLENTIENWIKQSNLVREITIEELQDSLKPTGMGNLWVRGSLVRGHFPCGDIDISDYSDQKRFDFSNFPRDFKGLPIEYAHVPLEYLEDFLTTYLRYSASADEIIPLTDDSDRVESIMNKASSLFYETMTGDYGLFRSFEEEEFYHQTQITYWSDYRQLKEINGGKRTADRVYWLSKCIFPEYRPFNNHSALIYQMMHDGKIPTDVGCAILDIATVVKVDPNKYSEITSLIVPWYKEQFLPLVESELINNLPSQDLEIIFRCRKYGSQPDELEETFNLIPNLGYPHRKWLAAWVLSQNPLCSTELLAKMWEQYSGIYSYTNVKRNLIRHQNFPLGIVQKSEVEDDDHLSRSFIEVSQNRKFTPTFILNTKQ